MGLILLILAIIFFLSWRYIDYLQEKASQDKEIKRLQDENYQLLNENRNLKEFLED